MKAGIAGAGILGRLLAFGLQKNGWDVTLIDQGSETSCSMAAAGLLTPLAELEKHDLIIYQLGTDAIQTHWPAIIAELEEPIYFQQNGSLLLSHPRDQIELTRFKQILADKLPDKKPYQELQSTEISTLEPSITEFNKGYYFPNEAHLDAQATFKALGHYLKEIRWLSNTTVVDVRPGAITLKDRSENFDITFDCRGLGAKQHFPDLRGVRGEIIWLDAPEVKISRPIRLVHPRYSLYIVPRPGQRYIVGASEIESNDLSEISVRSTLELLTAAYTVHPGFAEARILKTLTHCRPTLNNNNPIIKYADGYIGVNGLFRHGYLISPTLVIDILIWLKWGISQVKYPQLWEKMQ